jgi:C4-dicarboxylate-binding protein DctP
MKTRHMLAAAASLLALSTVPALASCEDGEEVIKFAHVTNSDKHPKGIAAQLFADRVNDEMNGVACVEVYPNSTLYDDDKVLEAMLAGDVQMAAPSLSKFETFTKKLRSTTCRSSSSTSTPSIATRIPRTARLCSIRCSARDCRALGTGIRA